MTNSPNQQTVLFENQTLENVEQFTYFGGIVMLQGGTKEDIKSRFNKARAVFARMKPVWKSNIDSRGTNLDSTKVLIYQFYSTDQNVGGQPRKMFTNYPPFITHVSVESKEFFGQIKYLTANFSKTLVKKSWITS